MAPSKSTFPFSLSSTTFPESRAAFQPTALRAIEDDFSKLPSFLRPTTTRRRKPPTLPLANLESAIVHAAPTAASSNPAVAEWHVMPEANLTPEQERDLRVIENRHHLDPKRFYKASGTGRKRGELPSRVQFGAVVVGAHEFYSGRVVKRERRGRIMQAVMADARVRRFTKNKFKKLQQQKGKRRVVDPAARRKPKQRSTRW